MKTRGARSWTGALTLGLTALTLSSEARTQTARVQATEIEVKAAFLYHFA